MNNMFLEGLQRYRKNQKVQTIEEEVYNIKNDISEIKSLLKELLKQ